MIKKVLLVASLCAGWRSKASASGMLNRRLIPTGRSG